jgi:hypothetical protein
MMCQVLGFEYDEPLTTRLIDKHYTATGRPFRCCQPRDLLLLSRNFCEYNKQPVRLTDDILDFAVSVYFTVMEGK